jgi:hypothetical protein
MPPEPRDGRPEAQTANPTTRCLSHDLPSFCHRPQATACNCQSVSQSSPSTKRSSVEEKIVTLHLPTLPSQLASQPVAPASLRLLGQDKHFLSLSTTTTTYRPHHHCWPQPPFLSFFLLDSLVPRSLLLFLQASLSPVPTALAPSAVSLSQNSTSQCCWVLPLGHIQTANQRLLLKR